MEDSIFDLYGPPASLKSRLNEDGISAFPSTTFEEEEEKPFHLSAIFLESQAWHFPIASGKPAEIALFGNDTGAHGIILRKKYTAHMIQGCDYSLSYRPLEIEQSGSKKRAFAEAVKISPIPILGTIVRFDDAQLFRAGRAALRSFNSLEPNGFPSKIIKEAAKEHPTYP